MLLIPTLLFAAGPEPQHAQGALASGAEPTLKELRVQLELIDAQQKHAVEAFERGKAQIEAGTLRQGMAASWDRELKAKRAEVEARIKRLEEPEEKP